MSDDPGVPRAASEGAKKPRRLPLETLDTTRGCQVHRLFARSVRVGRRRRLHLPSIYGLSLGLTFVPLLVGALVSPLPMARVEGGHRLPFLLDWNVLFMFLVSFPSLVILTVTNQNALTTSLRSVQLDGTLSIGPGEAAALSARWGRRFLWINRASLSVGTVLGIVVAYYNFLAYAAPSVGHWMADQGRLLPVGYVFLYCVFLFYALVPTFVLRNVAIALFFKDLVDHAQLRLLPLHPDKSGGLRPMGQLGLRNQYALTLLGLNLVLLVVTSIQYLQMPPMLYGLIAAASTAYLILGPLVFVAPLLPFRDGMRRTKADLLGEVAKRLRVELQRLRGQLPEGSITKEDEELIDRLRKIGAVVDELPVWPFDAGTVKKFLMAYVVPLLSGAAVPALRFVVERLTAT